MGCMLHESETLEGGKCIYLFLEDIYDLRIERDVMANWQAVLLDGALSGPDMRAAKPIIIRLKRAPIVEANTAHHILTYPCLSLRSWVELIYSV